MPLQLVWGNACTQLVIPVYQRNYAWKIENCNQLFTDLIKLKIVSGRDISLDPLSLRPPVQDLTD